MAFRVLFIGEIVGKAGIFCVKTLLPDLRRELAVDFVIANGDGATGGFGIGKNHSIYLRKLGIDVITTGDQVYFKKDMVPHIDKASYILRPANLPASNPGRGWRYYTVGGRAPSAADRKSVAVASSGDAAVSDAAAGGAAVRDAASGPAAGRAATAGDSAAGREHPGGDGPDADADRRSPDTPVDTPEEEGGSTDGDGSPARIAVINFLGQSGYSRAHASNPFTFLPELVARIRERTSIIILDFHAVTTAEKTSMFFHADGKVTAVIGTGTRALTADAAVLPGGTGVITDVGRTGSLQSVSGLSPDVEIRKFLNQVPERSKDAWEGLELQAVLLDIDDSGKTTNVTTLRRPCPEGSIDGRNGDNSAD